MRWMRRIVMATLPRAGASMATSAQVYVAEDAFLRDER
jgi:hypothetical protein